jgi:hypothetical protein
MPRSRLDHKIKVVLGNAEQLLRGVVSLPHDKIGGSEVKAAALESVAHVDNSSHGLNERAKESKKEAKARQIQKNQKS